MPGSNQYAAIKPSSARVEVDLDPTFTDQVTAAYLSLLIYVPSTAQADLFPNVDSTILAIIKTDRFNIGIHRTGGTYYWYSGAGAGADFATVTFDSWVQVEIHAIAGNTTYDVRIDGVLHAGMTNASLPATGVNFLSGRGLDPTWVGTGGGSIADDTIGYDELSWSLTNWVSIGGAIARWAFDGATPLTTAAVNYPDPPWATGGTSPLTNITITTGGGTLADLFGTPPPPVTSGLLVTLDGVDFSFCALEGSVTRRLNRPALATIKIPMDCVDGCSGPGARLLISFDGGATIFFHGMVMDWELDGDEDFGYITMNASDPMELWAWRVARDDTGDFTVPTFIQDYITGPEIMYDILSNTVNTAAGPPADAEGPIFLNLNAPATGGCDLTGAPVDWPMTISQVFSLLGSTGCVDVVITPTDPGGGVMGDVDFYNGDYGTDLSGSVVFEYGTGSLNVRALRWNQDMSQIINKDWYYLGPRVQTEADPAGDQHWRANITGQNQAFNTVDVTPTGAWGGGNAYVNLDTVTDGGVTYVCHLAHTSTATDEPGVGIHWPRYWFVWKAPPGGRSVDATNTPVGPPWTDNPLGECIYNSRIAYGVRMKVDIYDARGDEATVGRELYQRLWQAESWLRQNPRTLVHVTPTRGTEIGTFDIGDLVGVNIGAQICGGISGAQRVYQYTISWTEDGPFELSELQTSSDTGVDTGV